jgi:hypothetical protein
VFLRDSRIKYSKQSFWILRFLWFFWVYYFSYKRIVTRFGLCPATCESVQYCLICCWCRWKTAAAGKSTTFCCCWWCCFRKYKWYLNLLRNRQGWILIFQMMKQWSVSTYCLPNYKIKKRIMKDVLCSVVMLWVCFILKNL